MFFGFFFYFSYCEYLKDRTVNVTLDGSWPDTPLLSEAAAFIADANGEAYWTFINGLQKLEKYPETRDEIKEYALNFLSDELRSLLELALLTRAYSPRIEMFRQILKNITNDMNKPVAVYVGKPYYSHDDLEKALKHQKSNPVVYAYEPRNGNIKDTVVLYSPMNDTMLFDWIKFLETKDEEISFVYRPVGEFSNEPVKFRGYGFEMRPFNYTMTYLKEGEDQIKRGVESEDTQLMKKKRIVPGPNVPKPADLATQIIQFVKTTNDPFKSLLELCENFPLFADNISRIPVAQSLREKIFDKPENIISGASAIYVNNRLIRNADVYHILQASLDELRIAQMLREHFSLTAESLNKSISLIETKKPPKSVIIDYKSDFIYNLNDIETGKAYENWTTDLSSLRTSNPINIKRNVFNAVFMIDPLNYADMKTLEKIDNQTRLRAPVRFSYFVQTRLTTKLSKRVMFAWAHMRLRYGFRQANQFLLDARKAMKPGETELKNIHFNTALENQCKKKLADFDSPESTVRERKYLKKMRVFQDRLGIHQQGCIFNGRFYVGKRQEKKLGEFIDKSLKRLRIKMAEKSFANRTMDTLEAILDGPDVFKRYNPLIQHTDRSPCEFVPLISQSYYFQHAFMEWTKKIRYNSKNQSVKYSTIWVFIGEELSGSLEAKHMGFQTENWVKTMPTNARIAFFSETTTSNVIRNPLPPAFVQDLLQLKPDEITIVMNGRVIRMKSRVIFDWLPEDFNLLLKWEYHRSVSMVERFFAEDVALNYDILQDDIDNIDSSFHSQLALYLSFIYGYASHNGINRYPIDNRLFKEGNPACMNYNNGDSFIHYAILLNPFELPFQRIAPIIEFLRNTTSFDVKIFINFPTKDVHDFPSNFRAFHRFLLQEDFISFQRFDSHTVYSLMPHPPENWMVEPVSAPFDLDNFKPGEVDPGTTVASYRLSSILLEGSALDEQYVPVHGLRITLDMGSKGYHDSLSIKTMGYFQLKTQPGIWEVSLGEGPSQTVYNISSKNEFSISSFVPKWMTMLVTHNDGMSKYTIFDLPKELKQKNNTIDPTIHVFAVVSGYLYEKLVKIMMISALKNTKSPMHFWFLKNFISSQFMNDLPLFASKYHFNYSFVEYHWPAWVAPQTERQRIIWGNKILFFDALFPTNISKIIYIDADAVVRGDLAELMKYDLAGCPYGFVPFCTSRKEMKKYHFWNQGYWLRHLNGKNYHISAMFVVDLDRFRRMGAGDKLRKHYELIVGNTKSLANLDQDLPNDAQSEVPIFSLPKKFLWCCTWCSEREKDRAYIIDLANDPKTKMSKVEMAKKYIEEWPLLHDEVMHLENFSYFNAYDLKAIRIEHKKQIALEIEAKRNNSKKNQNSQDKIGSQKNQESKAQEKDTVKESAKEEKKTDTKKGKKEATKAKSQNKNIDIDDNL